MIVIDLCRLDFHLGRGICADRGEKTLVFQQKVEKDLLFGCLCNKLLPQLTSGPLGRRKRLMQPIKLRFSKRNHLLFLKQAVETEQIKSDKVAEAPEALLKGCKVPGKKGPLY